MQDTLGDRMKAYESYETSRIYNSDVPLIVRLDGRAFSTFTRQCDKPFDSTFTSIMDQVTAYLIEQTHAKIGYTQSDEITLVYMKTNNTSQPLFGGRVFKICSLLAGMASAKFVDLAKEHNFQNYMACFDCRAFTVPTVLEAVNCLVWREVDASRNAVQMVAQSHFSPNQLHRKSCDQLEEMLQARGISMSDFAPRHRWGAYMARTVSMRMLTEQELEKIPPAHRPTGPILRSQIQSLPIAPIRNRIDKVDIIMHSIKQSDETDVAI